MTTNTDIQDPASAAPVPAAAIAGAGAEQFYPMSRQGRRQAIILLAGVASIWVFALWTLLTILQDGVGGVEWVSFALMLALLLVAPLVAWTLLEEAYSRITTSSEGIRYRTIGGVDLTYGWDELTGFKAKGSRGRIARFFLGESGEQEEDSNIVSKAEAQRPRHGGNPTEDKGKDTGAATAGPDTQIDLAARATEEGSNNQEASDNNEDADEGDADTLLLQVRANRASQIANPLTRLLHTLAHGSALPIYGNLERRDELLSELARRLPTLTNP